MIGFRDKMAANRAAGRYLSFDLGQLEDRTSLQLTCEVAAGYRVFPAQWWPDLRGLLIVIALIRDLAPQAVITVDGGYGNPEVGSAEASQAYVEIGGDAAIVNPFCGSDALRPFLDYEGRGVFVLCRTGNQSADRLQRAVVDVVESKTLSQQIAHLAWSFWNEQRNVGLVCAPRRVQELRYLRDAAVDLPLFVTRVEDWEHDLPSAVRWAKPGGPFLISAPFRPRTPEAVAKWQEMIEAAVAAT